LRQLDELARERVRVESEERSAVARELHDLVAHSLSVTTMLVLASSLSDDRDTLRATLGRVRRSTEAARSELDTLLHALRGPGSGHQRLAPLVTPTASAQALGQQLSENGHHPVLDIDAAAYDLDPTTQRTLSRIMQEAATNILRYAPAGSPCHYTLVTEDAGVRLTVLSPMADRRSSDLSLGWGLRGIRERVELTRGTFRAGPEGGRWRLAVTLPHPEQPSRAEAGPPAAVGASLVPGIRTGSMT
jgi:signal transduction histidine kinase